MSGLERIILHWSGGAHSVTALDRQHYHFIIDGGGAVHEGDHKPEANGGAVQAGRYAAHTLNCNTGSIGIALAAMAGAVERPFAPGAHPITEAQIGALAALVARLCTQYRIPVTRRTVLSHAEVQPTLGITQRGKWDIAWLPGMDRPGDPVEVGDRLRDRILGAMPAANTAEAAPLVPPTIHRGDVGLPVTRLQAILTARGHPSGTIDGVFGRQTLNAVQAFQRAVGLSADGIVGPGTWAEILKED